MSEKPWQLYTEIPTPTLLTPSSSVIDLSSSTVNADDSTLGNYHQGLDSSVIINGEIEGEEPLVTPKELKGWYIYSAATEVYSVVAISAFIPIILENLASEAGFELDQITPCDTSIKGYKCVTRYGSGFVDTASFSLYTISISVFIQFLVYISFGSLADHGENRKKFLLFFSYVGAISTIAFLLVIKPSLYWLAGLLTIISNVCFGAGFVFYMAYIPTFTRLHPSVSDARKLGISTQELSKIEDVVSNRLSSHSIAIGYAAGVLVLIIAAGISLLMKTSTYGLQVGTALAGVWWFILLTFPAIWLQKRKNPPLPKGENFVFYSFKRVGRTMGSIKKLSQSMKFLISWFLLSDGFNTIISVALIFGKKNLLLNNTQLTIAAIIVPISAFVGVYFFLSIQQKFNLETKTMILITGTLHFLIPIYGLFGFTTTIGFKHTQEIFIFAAYFGFMLGAIQSYCRVLFGSMIPQGHENEFFGLYAITDKGSSWVGPLITGLIGDLTHDLRYGFWFLLGVMIIPLLLISNIDVKKGKKEAELYFENEQSKFKEEEEEEEEEEEKIQ